ncbi:unnamed protein product, partial [Closterium sp. NIES-54]
MKNCVNGMRKSILGPRRSSSRPIPATGGTHDNVGYECAENRGTIGAGGGRAVGDGVSGTTGADAGGAT